MISWIRQFNISQLKDKSEKTTQNVNETEMEIPINKETGRTRSSNIYHGNFRNEENSNYIIQQIKTSDTEFTRKQKFSTFPPLWSQVQVVCFWWGWYWVGTEASALC